jgi:hypothetical protein
MKMFIQIRLTDESTEPQDVNDESGNDRATYDQHGAQQADVPDLRLHGLSLEPQALRCHSLVLLEVSALRFENLVQQLFGPVVSCHGLRLNMAYTRKMVPKIREILL